MVLAVVLGGCGDDAQDGAEETDGLPSGTGGTGAAMGSGGADGSATSPASQSGGTGAVMVPGGESQGEAGMIGADDCQPDTYPEAGRCYECAAEACCVPLAVCADNGRGWFDGGTFFRAYTECFDGPLACARQCFSREVAAAMSMASDIAHACAVECGADFEQVLDPVTQEPSYLTRDAFISLVDCLAALTEVPEPEDDGGAAGESCAASCFEGWR
jgi:hypothetical protein